MATVEERLAKVERDLAVIIRDKQAATSKLGWLEPVRGSFKDDPDFKEIVQLGKEIRDDDSIDGQP